MAARSKAATQNKVRGGKKSHAKKISGKRARLPPRTAAAVVPPIPLAAKTAAGKCDDASPNLQPLAEWTVTAEAFCNEAEDTYEKWASKDLRDNRQRSFCRNEMLRLARIGKDAVIRYEEIEACTTRKSGTAASRSVLNELKKWRLCELLKEITAAAQEMCGRLAEPYSKETMERISEDFRDLAKAIRALRAASSAIREWIQGGDGKRLSEALPPKSRTALTDLLKSLGRFIGSALSKSAVEVEPAVAFERDLPGRLKATREMEDCIAMLRVSVNEFIESHLHEIHSGDGRFADNVRYLLERTLAAGECAKDLLDYALHALEAACRVDQQVDSMAKELREAIWRAKREHETFAAAVEHWRKRVERAPFRHKLRRKPLPRWGELSTEEQQLVTVLVRLRDGDPDGEHFVTTRTTIETALLHPAKSKTGVATWRLLEHLENEHEIVGSHRQKPSRERPQVVVNYWIAEDACREYRPHVRAASAGSSPAPS